MTLDRGHHMYVLALNRMTLRSRSERRGLVGRSGSEVSFPPRRVQMQPEFLPSVALLSSPWSGEHVSLDRTLVSCLDSKFSRGDRAVEERLPVICQARFFCVRKLRLLQFSSLQKLGMSPIGGLQGYRAAAIGLPGSL